MHHPPDKFILCIFAFRDLHVFFLIQNENYLKKFLYYEKYRNVCWHVDGHSQYIIHYYMTLHNTRDNQIPII